MHAPPLQLDAAVDPAAASPFAVVTCLLLSCALACDAVCAFSCPGLQECATVKMFCDTQVEAVSVDADQLQLTAMAKGWGCRIRIAYLDASPGDKVRASRTAQAQSQGAT